MQLLGVGIVRPPTKEVYVRKCGLACRVTTQPNENDFVINEGERGM